MNGPLIVLIAIAMICAAVLGIVTRAVDQRRIARLRALHRHRQREQALLFYATKDNWRHRHKVGRHWVNSPAATDRGARARQALEARD